MIRIGILGCGAIGSGIAKNFSKELKGYCRLTGLCDIDQEKSIELAKSLAIKSIVKHDFDQLLKSCDLVVESVNADNAAALIERALRARRHVLVMSIGKLLNHPNIFKLSQKYKRNLLLPTGAIAGIDAIKAACLTTANKIILTTKKPTTGFQGVHYLSGKGIDLAKLKEQTLIFEGSVYEAVKAFPRNINVAATLALACGEINSRKIVVRIITSPNFRRNSHEIIVEGAFGKIMCRTENTISPYNPKTSYMAVLSGIQTLKGFCSQVKIGT